MKIGNFFFVYIKIEIVFQPSDSSKVSDLKSRSTIFGSIRISNCSNRLLNPWKAIKKDNLNNFNQL